VVELSQVRVGELLAECMLSLVVAVRFENNWEDLHPFILQKVKEDGAPTQRIRLRVLTCCSLTRSAGEGRA
jgi:hypothetical protein